MGAGSVFKITSNGTLTTLYSFCSQSGCTDGSAPYGRLAPATNGDFYGTTYAGGVTCALNTFGCGTVFKMTPKGKLTTLYTFCSQSGCTDGASPQAGLLQATNGNLYGTTVYGGANLQCYSHPGGPLIGCGTVFKISPSGTLKTLYSFCSQTGCTDGQFPTAGLVQAINGDLYGTTEFGGVNGYGTVFKITPSGTLKTLYTFCSQTGCMDGYGPSAGLIQATNGDLYGTTRYGGINSEGTIFKITPSGTLKTLYSFCAQSGCPDGANPEAGLIQATDGDFYGTTYDGGANAAGTVFKMTPSGKLTTLYSFCSQSGCTDGEYPYAALVQETSGDLYGATFQGGAYGVTYDGFGTVFSLSVGLGPFVETQTTSGKVGAAVTILGTDLTGATSVTFNGTTAAFTVDSTGTAISTTVPTGATTGTVQVVTPGSTLSSNVPFRVP
jgi:uncharacterized repeat protein (TIGR03803 family)